MIQNEILVGQHKSWKLIKKLGEGDAGEVYLAASQEDSLQAIVKRPHKSAFTSDTARQASQIESEGKILEALKGVSYGNSGFAITTPTLLDRSRAGTGYGEGVFIVIEEAAGIDLNLLTRVVRFGTKEAIADETMFDSAIQHYIHRIAEKGEVPQVLLLRALACIIQLLQAIHAFSAAVESPAKNGILWNDIKPDHIFWDPVSRRFTIIDWGNSQFLGLDGTSEDRRLSRVDDYRQLIEEMGRFLNIASPELYRKIHWPGFSLSADTFVKNFSALDETVHDLLEEENQRTLQIRQEETALLGSEQVSIRELEKLDQVHKQIYLVGEMPDTSGALKFCRRLASQLAFQRSPVEFRWVSLWASRQPSVEEKQWQVYARIAEAAGSVQRETRTAYLDALVEGISGNGLEMLWNLLEASRDNQNPAWWQEISGLIRKSQLPTDSLPPYRTAQQILQGIQLASKQMEDYEQGKSDQIASKFLNQGSISEQRQKFERVIKRLNEEILPNWVNSSPAPPDSSLDYSPVENAISEIGGSLPEAQQVLIRSLYQPKAQVKIILDAWGSQEFNTASQALRRLLIWDPDRKRVLAAEEAIQKAPDWLSKVRKGPQRGESPLDFAAQMEFEGRELRNRVGGAAWLDNTLEAFSRLRRGSRPAALAASHPEWTKEILWLAKVRPVDHVESLPAASAPKVVRQAAPPRKPVVGSLERMPANNKAYSLIQGIKEGELGEGKDLLLTTSLDTWTPEAQGSSARVFQGFLRSEAGILKQAAIKLMRLDKVDYALPLFEEEIQILSVLNDVQGITRLMECGFIQPKGEYTFSTEESQKGYRGLTGVMLRYGNDSVEAYKEALHAKVEEGWIPYLALEERAAQENLLMMCDSGHTSGRLLPVSDGIKMAVQICDILEEAHQRGVVYRDHKILHYYWVESYNGIYIIDWNVAKYSPQPLPQTEIQHDLVQFGARALHHILTGRTAPGALPLGPTRPEEIEQAANSYHAQWTYDDRRLPKTVKTLIEKTLEGGYERAVQLRSDLLKCLNDLDKEPKPHKD